MNSQEEATAALWQSLVAKGVAEFDVHDRPSDEVMVLERSKQVGVNLPSVHRIVKGDGRLYSTIMDRVHLPIQLAEYLNWSLANCRPTTLPYTSSTRECIVML